MFGVHVEKIWSLSWPPSARKCKGSEPRYTNPDVGRARTGRTRTQLSHIGPIIGPAPTLDPHNIFLISHYRLELKKSRYRFNLISYMNPQIKNNRSVQGSYVWIPNHVGHGKSKDVYVRHACSLNHVDNPEQKHMWRVWKLYVSQWCRGQNTGDGRSFTQWLPFEKPGRLKADPFA